MYIYIYARACGIRGECIRELSYERENCAATGEYVERIYPTRAKRARGGEGERVGAAAERRLVSRKLRSYAMERPLDYLCRAEARLLGKETL